MLYPFIESMCGRFTLTTNDYRSVEQAVGATFDPAFVQEFRPRFNVAPADRHWIVCETQSGARSIVPATWGFVVVQANASPRVHINARSESVSTRSTFRDPFAHTRCVVLADGFYEWIGPRRDRRPIWFRRPCAPLMLLAGLFRETDERETIGGDRQFLILTTRASEHVLSIHDRMPAIVAATELDAWLARDAADLGTLRRKIARPFGEPLEALAVSRRVNDPRNDDPCCIEPDNVPRQQRLFD